jgi:hypothetical protein
VRRGEERKGMRRLVYVIALPMLVMMIFAPATIAQDVDCPQLTFEEAQAILAADPSDPNRLDADGDGIACDRSNTLPSQPKVEEQPQESQSLPATGGPMAPSVLLVASALLLGSGVMSYTLLRRR